MVRRFGRASGRMDLEATNENGLMVKAVGTPRYKRYQIDGKRYRHDTQGRYGGLTHACKLGLRIEAARLALPLRALAAVGQEQEPKAPGRETGRGGRMGQDETAMTGKKRPMIFD